MVSTTLPAAGAMTGARYLESLRDGRDVWLDGERVNDVTTHPALRAFAHELARVYDLQHSEQYRDEMTYLSPETGNRVSLCWLIPHTFEEMKRKRRNSEHWADLTWGQLGRSPDILAPFITSLAQRRDLLSAVQNDHADFGANAANFANLCREHDLFLTHALVDPQVDRTEQPQNEQRRVAEDAEVALHVVRETSEGVIVRGAKQLATAAPFSHETYVSLNATFIRRADPRFVLAFSIPTNAPGLKIFCREPVSRWVGSWGHPLQMLDEQDCMLFFQDVLVPWDRLFMLYDPSPLVEALTTGGVNFMGWADLCRIHTRMRLLTAVATLCARAIGVIEYREVGAKLGEMVNYCELFRHAMEGIEHESYITDSGELSLGGPTRALTVWFAQISERMVQLLREICGSGIIMQPSERDLASPELRPFLDTYMHGKALDVDAKSRLFRLAHELAAGVFGMRQDIYEYWHGGDPNRNRINLLRDYDQQPFSDRILAMCAAPLPHGDLPSSAE